MKKFLVATIFLAFQIAFSQNNSAEIVVLNKDKAPTISKHIYGHFAEHLGRCIYDGIYVGDKSSIANTNGVRNDIIKALQELKVPNLRWPGGCFADTYHWKDGIGAKNERPSIVNRWWGGTSENNSFGTHEFLDLCEILGTEPYLAGNVGSGTPRELDEWVQYVNYKPGSPMADLRVKNGRKSPWDVSIWGVGNEMWGCGGNMTAEYYVNLYKQYATFMPSGDSKLFRIASGANGDDYHWTEVLMRDIPKSLIEGVAMHWYTVIDWAKKGHSTNFDESVYFESMKQALRMEELVTKHSEIMDKYDPEKKVALIVDEWGGWYEPDDTAKWGVLYQQNTIRDAMIAGVTLNIFNNHADRVRGANLAQVVNVLQSVILTDKEKMLLTPTYYVMKMYNVHQDAQLIPLKIESPKYVLDNKELPAVSVSASKDKNSLVHISLVNIDSQKQNKVKINVQQLGLKNISGQILTAPKITDYNSFENSDKIKPAVFKSFTIKNNQLEITLPPHSVVVLEGK
jgi:alpha-N-arabinofuranosidase